MSRFGNRMPRNFDVDAYMTRLWGDGKRGPIGKAPLPVPIVGTAVDLPDIFQAYCAANGLAMPVKEYRFHPQRKWRFDYCWIANKVAVEIDGGIWQEGRHTRGSGFIADQQKRNAAQLLGFRVLCYDPTRYAEAIVDLKILLATGA